jgi:hypothetical protein
VTFDIDANGILNVSAKDRATGKEQKIRIEASSGLSEGEIDRMVKDAESHAEDDKRRREEVETRNRLDALTYEVEKNMKEWEDKLDSGTKERLTAALERSRKALKQSDLAEISAASDELQQAYTAAAHRSTRRSRRAPTVPTRDSVAARRRAPASPMTRPRVATQPPMRTSSKPTTRSSRTTSKSSRVRTSDAVRCYRGGDPPWKRLVPSPVNCGAAHDVLLCYLAWAMLVGPGARLWMI